MYTTFLAGAANVAELGRPTTEAPAPKSRRKRAQVARACDWCRVHRIRCDNSHPCSRCIERGGECTVHGKTDIRTISSPQAYRTIERLEQRVRELEQELEHHRNPTAPSGSSRASPRTPASRPLSTPPGGDDILELPMNEQIDRSGVAVHEGIRIRTAQSQYETWYGPGSLYYFIRRLNDFVNTCLRQSRPIARMLPDSETNLFDEPSQSGTGSHNSPAAPAVGNSVTAGDALTPTQEEYFISLYWQSYHTTLFVLDEAAFKEHYHSLWATKGQERKPSALVDIVIALCMQYGMASKPGLVSASAEGDGRDPVVAGRCVRSYPHPTSAAGVIPTLPAEDAMADSACALAVRTAYMLGLHLEPPLEMPKRQREIRKRLWWALYVQDSKFSMKLGRPFLLNPPTASCLLPGDDREEALSSGSFFTPIGDGVTWLTFNVEIIKLFQAFRAAYKAFYRGPGAVSIFKDEPGKDTSSSIEAQAEFVIPYISRIEEWVKKVPEPLTTKRLGNGMPFSTDGSSFEIEEFASLWLQRQRLLLELTYHHLSINLNRPFIRFGAWSADTPVADRYATQCAAHAITLTQAMHHVNKSTSILKGWNEAFQWQWNATMSLVGFVFAYPSHPLSPAARNAMDLSITVFESFGGCLAPAQKAVPIIRDLSTQADQLTKQTLGLENSVSSAQEQPLIALGDLRLDFETSMGNTKWGNSGITPWGFLDEISTDAIQGMLSQSMDMAYSVDAQRFDMLPWPDVNSYQVSQWANTY
ncbi:hypothetical protein NPX13_g479 [Xylaria arbuscula]|uniref:Zn(2)-C6 fungal-type domain-containing protein n=1 Tax=Xylaria arbuscula TaxID=114810 RepID=A0A9W8NMT0_9PEZI|nr:hypothetical protein NPX13_g479 [Xylaria arbuscula]